MRAYHWYLYHYQRILFGVASLRRNKVDRGKARVCHFGPYREYRENEVDLRCRARAVLEPAKPARDAARALGNCIARNQDPDSFVIGQFYGSARAFIGSLSVTVAVYK